MTCLKKRSYPDAQAGSLLRGVAARTREELCRRGRYLAGILLVLHMGGRLPADSGAQGLPALQQVRFAAGLLKSRQPQRAELHMRRFLQRHPDSALGYQVLAASFMLRGQIDSALVYYQAAAGLDSFLAEAHHGLGLVYTYEGENEKACNEFERAIALDAGQPAFHYNAGLVYEYRGMPLDAGIAFDAVLKIDPWNTAAHRKVGAILLWHNRPEEALEHYVEACLLAPQEAGSWYGTAKAHVALKQDSLAIVCLERALSLDKSDPQVLYQLGLLYRRSGRMEEARQMLERFRALKQDREPDQRKQLMITDPDLARNQFQLGRLYVRGRRPAAAAARFERARQLGFEGEKLPRGGSGNPARMERLAGLEALRAQEFFLAATHYLAAARLERDNPQNFRHLGLALTHVERNAEAVTALEKAVQLDPALHKAFNDLAVIHCKDPTDLERAAALLHKAVELKPGEKLYRFNLGQVYFFLARFTKAADWLGEVVEQDPNSALAKYSLGMALGRLDRGEEAADHLEKAIAINPEYADAHYELGKAYKALGRMEEAAAAYERCMQLKPEHKQAHYGLGQAYLKLGRPAAARQALGRFQQLEEHRKPQHLFYALPDSI